MSGRGRYLRCDRFLLPSQDEAVLRHFLEHHFVAHSARERARVLAARWSVSGGMSGTARRLLLGSDPPEADAPDGAATLRRSFERGGVEPGGRWIQLLDYTTGARRGSVTFVFPPGRTEPAVVVKLRPLGEGTSSLRLEWEATVDAWYRLPADVRAHMPEPLAYSDDEGVELLSLSFVPGRPVYLDMRNLLAPSREAARHMEAAAAWLARFHEVTADPLTPVHPERDLPSPEELTEVIRAGHAERELGWFLELREALAARPLPATAVHGDFWARNLLIGNGELPGVVDWEGFRPRGGPAVDLFHFPLSYGLNHPWARYRRLPPDVAFRRTFLERNRVSKAVRRYFARYVRRSGMDPDLLRPLFLLHLLRRGAARSGVAPAEGSEGAGRSWRSAYHMLLRAPETIFSS